MFFAYKKILININQVISVDLRDIESLRIELMVEGDMGGCEKIFLTDMDSVNFLYRCKILTISV